MVTIFICDGMTVKTSNKGVETGYFQRVLEQKSENNWKSAKSAVIEDGVSKMASSRLLKGKVKPSRFTFVALILRWRRM